MAKAPALSVVVPAYNEEAGIRRVLQDLERVLAAGASAYEILVVDDGSDDRTAEIVRESGTASAVLLRHPVNRGYGRSLLTGISRASHDWVLTIDGDGTYPADAVPDLLAALPGCDMVVGAREGDVYWGGAGQALLRRIYLFLVSFVVGERVPDANSGLRVFRKSAFEASSPIECYGFSFSTTLTLSFLKSGRFVRFIPIRYYERKGRSKVHKGRDILRTLQIMAQIMVYYNPLKLAVSLACLPAALALAAAFAWWRTGGGVYAGIAALNLLGALGVFLAGCGLEAIRLNGARRPVP